MGSPVAYKTVGACLSKRMRHEDPSGRATDKRSGSIAAARRQPPPCSTHQICLGIMEFTWDKQPPPPPARRMPGLVHVRAIGTRAMATEEAMARQWPTGPYVPFWYKECNTKTTRGEDTNGFAAALQRYATASPRQTGTPRSAGRYHKIHMCGDINGNAEPPPPPPRTHTPSLSFS